MGIESRRDKLIYHGFIPVLGAIFGAISATWFQSVNLDTAQSDDVVTLLKDPSLTPQQKLQALEIYKEITDRPWGVIRSLVGSLTTAIAVAIGALVVGGYFRRN